MFRSHATLVGYASWKRIRTSSYSASQLKYGFVTIGIRYLAARSIS